MTSGIVLLIVAVVLIVLIAYLIGIMTRKKNDGRIADLEERKEQLRKLPVAQELEAIYNLHLVGQSFDGYQNWKNKWTAIETNTFSTLEQKLEEVELLNDTFHFVKVNKELKTIETQLSETETELTSLREGLAVLREQEEKNSARVKYALDLYEELQDSISGQESAFGTALPEINKQLTNIQAEFSQFVALNSSGDPLEAADILERAEEHTIALGQISEKIPDLVLLLQDKLPDQLEDLESGYAKLLEEGYHFGDQPIESRFQTIREAIADGKDDIAQLELDKAEAGTVDTQERLDNLYALFDKEIAANKEVKKTIRLIPSYLEHLKGNNSTLQEELLRLTQSYILSDSESSSLKAISKELERIDQELLPGLVEEDLPEQPFTTLETVYGNAVRIMEKLEQEQQDLLARFKLVEKDEQHARQFADKAINELHSIKRYMEKRHLPGIPQEFLSIFFTTSSQLEALITELDRNRIDIQMVKKLSDSAEKAILLLEETTYSLVQYATLTEQLLQYSNRYRSYEPSIQNSFEVSLQLFEVNHDYRAAFDEIAYALEIVEPGVTDRFVTSYEKTREHVMF